LSDPSVFLFLVIMVDLGTTNSRGGVLEPSESRARASTRRPSLQAQAQGEGKSLWSHEAGHEIHLDGAVLDLLIGDIGVNTTPNFYRYMS
jgi:hypothetical protein